jgi:putative transposase
MTNHFHLLLRPEPQIPISRILQSLTVAHTWRSHRRHRTSGHVWQGRFKSPVIQDDAHLLVVLRYIEANPLRAGIVADLASYRWSSDRAHGLGQDDPLLSPLPEWEHLGATAAVRHAHWQARVRTPLTARELEEVRGSVRTGKPYGIPAWVAEQAPSLGLSPMPRPRGRPRKEAGK